VVLLLLSRYKCILDFQAIGNNWREIWFQINGYNYFPFKKQWVVLNELEKRKIYNQFNRFRRLENIGEF
jgi:hypothetical protein